MFTFCSLQGALSESTASQSLLELDGGVKVLIDVGWDESFDVDKLKELEKYVMPSQPVLRNERPLRIIERQLIASQTSADSVPDSPHTRDCVPSCRLRSLL